MFHVVKFPHHQVKEIKLQHVILIIYIYIYLDMDLVVSLLVRIDTPSVLILSNVDMWNVDKYMNDDSANVSKVTLLQYSFFLFFLNFFLFLVYKKILLLSSFVFLSRRYGQKKLLHKWRVYYFDSLDPKAKLFNIIKWISLLRTTVQRQQRFRSLRSIKKSLLYSF